MFNRGRFNHIRYNLYSVQETEIDIRELMIEVLNSMVTNGENVYVYDHCTERANASVYASAGDILAAALSAALDADVIVASQFALETAFEESVFASAHASEDCYISDALAAAISARAEIGSDEKIILALVEGLNASAFASADYFCPLVSMYTSLGAMVASSRFDISYIVLDVVIPPGGTLVIDSDNYVVLVNGENAIDKHGGAWLDELTRNTFDIQIEGESASELTGAILYTPRYL